MFSICSHDAWHMPDLNQNRSLHCATNDISLPGLGVRSHLISSTKSFSNSSSVCDMVCMLNQSWRNRTEHPLCLTARYWAFLCWKGHQSSDQMGPPQNATALLPPLWLLVGASVTGAPAYSTRPLPEVGCFVILIQGQSTMV